MAKTNKRIRRTLPTVYYPNGEVVGKEFAISDILPSRWMKEMVLHGPCGSSRYSVEFKRTKHSWKPYEYIEIVSMLKL